MQESPCTSPAEIHTPCLVCAPTGGVLPSAGHTRSQAWSSGILPEDSSGNPRVRNTQTAETGAKLGVPSSTFPPALSRGPPDSDRQEVRAPWRFPDGVLPTFPFPGRWFTSGPVLESPAVEEQSGLPQQGKWPPEGWGPLWWSQRKRRRWYFPGWRQICIIRWGCQRLLPCKRRRK